MSLAGSIDLWPAACCMASADCDLPCHGQQCPPVFVADTEGHEAHAEFNLHELRAPPNLPPWQGEVELLAELLANVEWQQFVGVLGIEPRKTLDGLVTQRALRLRLKAQQLQVPSCAGVGSLLCVHRRRSAALLAAAMPLMHAAQARHSSAMSCCASVPCM